MYTLCQGWQHRSNDSFSLMNLFTVQGTDSWPSLLLHTAWHALNIQLPPQQPRTPPSSSCCTPTSTATPPSCPPRRPKIESGKEQCAGPIVDVMMSWTLQKSSISGGWLACPNLQSSVLLVLMEPDLGSEMPTQVYSNSSEIHHILYPETKAPH